MVDLLPPPTPGGAKIAVDPKTGHLHVPPEPGKSPTDGLGAINLLQSVFPVGVSPLLRTFAASAILEARAKTRR